MATAPKAAAFRTTRRRLLGDDELDGSAEPARRVCRDADRTMNVIAVTPGRMRRVDGWADRIGFVAHAAAPDPTRCLSGSICDRVRADELVHEIIASMVGGLPTDPAPAPVDMVGLDRVGPRTVPEAVGWVVLISTGPADGVDRRELSIIATADGLVAGRPDATDRPCVLSPLDADALRLRLARALRAPIRSVRDLLDGD